MLRSPCGRRVGWQLAGDRQAKVPTDVMDVDDQAKPPQAVPQTATLAPDSTVQSKRAVDLESIVFSQEWHSMSNKKRKLPDGSFKRARKSYEEIHIPAPKQKPPAAGEIVPVSDLPLWVREAFRVHPESYSKHVVRYKHTYPPLQ